MNLKETRVNLWILHNYCHEAQANESRDNLHGNMLRMYSPTISNFLPSTVEDGPNRNFLNFYCHFLPITRKSKHESKDVPIQTNLQLNNNCFWLTK